MFGDLGGGLGEGVDGVGDFGFGEEGEARGEEVFGGGEAVEGSRVLEGGVAVCVLAGEGGEEETSGARMQKNIRRKLISSQQILAGQMHLSPRPKCHIMQGRF